MLICFGVEVSVRVQMGAEVLFEARRGGIFVVPSVYAR